MKEIKLTPPQAKVWQKNKRFKVLVCGRRFGKTFLAIAWLLTNASNKKGVHYYIAPSYVMAKTIAWALLKEMAGDRIKDKNESELKIELKNGSIVVLKGSENHNSLRGVSLSSAVLDEFAFMAHEVWTEVIRPATSDQLAPVLFITSPAGWNWAKDLHDFAARPENENWEAWTFTTLEGGNVLQSEIEEARKELPERTFRQEYLASFEALSNRVYSNFSHTVHVREDLTPPPEATRLYIGMDFNVTPMSAIVAVKVGDQLHCIDEISIEHSNTTEISQEIITRYVTPITLGGDPTHPTHPHHPPAITVYPDPSGRSRKTSAVGGETDFTILEGMGFQVRAPRKAPSVADRINEVQALLLNAAGDTKLYIHPRCKELIRCLGGLTYKAGTSQPDKNLGLDHMTDALGYLIHYEFPLKQRLTNFEVKFVM